MKDAMSVLENLGKIGYAEKEIVLTKDFVIKVRTLTAKQEADIFDRLDVVESNSAKIARLKICTLARAIIQINDAQFVVEEAKYVANEDLHEDEVPAEIAKKQKEIYNKMEATIEKWNSAIIDELYRQHSVLVNETMKKYKISDSD